jgi:hypothetical protein
MHSGENVAIKLGRIVGRLSRDADACAACRDRGVDMPTKKPRKSGAKFAGVWLSVTDRFGTATAAHLI